jgi:hypothetical protein
MLHCNYAQERGGVKLRVEEESRRRDDAESKIAHETTDAPVFNNSIKPEPCQPSYTCLRKYSIARGWVCVLFLV